MFFCHFFPARPGEEERYMISTFSHSQSDAISNDFLSGTNMPYCLLCLLIIVWPVCANKHLALKTKEQETKQRWVPKIWGLFKMKSVWCPAAVENMMLYRSMRGHVKTKAWIPGSYFHAGELMGRNTNSADCRWFPADQACQGDIISWQSGRTCTQTAGQSADRTLCSSGGFDEHRNSDSLEKVEAIPWMFICQKSQQPMRTCTPAAPLSEDHLRQLRARKIENCKKELEMDFFKHGHVVGMYWENIARSMVERAHRDARQLDVPLFCLQAADQRHARKNKTIDKQLTHQLLTVPNPHRTGKLQGILVSARKHDCALVWCLGSTSGTCERQDGNGCESGSAPRRSRTLAAQGSWFLSFRAWRKVFAHGRCSAGDMGRTIWKCGWSQRWCEDIVLCGTDACWFQNWFEDRRGRTRRLKWFAGQFPLLHGMLRTAYSAQGLTLDGGVLVDLRRAGGLEDDDWWLAMYVMLTRARKLENLILLGMTDQVEDLLRRGPPAYLRETDWQVGSQRCCHVGALAELASVLTQCKRPDIILCIWIQPLVLAERSVGIRDGWTLWRSTDMFDAFCLSYWYVDRWYPDMIWHVWCRECF